jgi:Protein of unknown function (DUF4232)
MHSSRASGRITALALSRLAAVCAVAAVLTACGTQTAPAGGTGSGGTAGGTGAGHTGSAGRSGGRAGGGSASPGKKQGPAATAACQPPAIRVTLDVRSTGVAAGTSYVPLDFTNVSRTTCQLAGFPVITLTSSTDKRIGTAAIADRGLAAESVILGAGQTAHIWLRVVDVMDLPTAQCQPTAAAGLRVGLPGQASTTFISHRLTTCTRQVRGSEILTVEPFRPGQARPGTAQ